MSQKMANLDWHTKHRRLLVVSLSLITLLFVLFWMPIPYKRIYNSKTLSPLAGVEDKHPHPKYKPEPDPRPPVKENFPLAASARSSSDLPPIPSWNTPPSPHVPEHTPLFIGFTRNWLLLQQAVVSYITAGWPPEDIYIIENTGTMNSNREGVLTLQNPFYMDYRRLTEVFGVNVITTPTLLTFAQLQNFYLYTAISKGWEHYFWGHMDVVALSNERWEDPDTGEFKSLYLRCVDDLRKSLATRLEIDEKGRGAAGWGIKFYAYDRLALVNRTAFEAVGGWDTMIPFYGTDCDMHSRLSMHGFKQDDARVGVVYDLANSLKNLAVLYRRQKLPESTDPPSKFPPEDTLGSKKFVSLRDNLNSMALNKNSGDRNLWQGAQQGGQGEPYYRDSAGFEKGIRMWQDFGKDVMTEKWGHRGCGLRKAGLDEDDAWRVEKDF